MTYLISGLPCSGKSTVASILSQITGQPILNVGSQLSMEIETLGISARRRSEIGHLFLSYFSVDEIERIIYREIAVNGPTIVDGIRFVSTCEKLSSRVPSVNLHVCAREELRVGRMQARVAPSEWNPQMLDEYMEYAGEEPQFVNSCDYLIENNESLDGLCEQVKKLWTKNFIV